MELEEIKNKSAVELKQLLFDKREELRHLRFQAQSRQLKQVNKMSEIKKTVARISMILSSKAKKN